MAICAAAYMAVTAFADNSVNLHDNDATQVEVYQSDAYREALEALKKAEQEFAKQEALADAEMAVSNELSEDDVSEDHCDSNTGDQNDVYSGNDYAPIIGEFRSDPYWESLEALKLADMNFKNVCSSLGVQSNYISILDSHNNRNNETVESYSANASSKRLSIIQVPQQRDYWCGYAAIKSLLGYEGINLTQTQIANDVYLTSEPCPWYNGNGMSRDLYPVPNYLKEKTGFDYVPYPIGTAGGKVLSASDIQGKITSTINNGHGILACGESYRTNDKLGSQLPGYPARNITHWVAVDGYVSNGSEVWIVDPAKSDVIPWSYDIEKYYTIPIEKLASFATMRGIIW